MTTQRSPAAKLQDSIVCATHAQRCVALTTIMSALIDLGFYEDEPVSGGDAVDEVARAYDLVTAITLRPGANIAPSAAGEPDDLLTECANCLREIRDQNLDGSEDELVDLVKKTLKYQMVVHVAAATETQVLATTTHMLSALRETGFDRDEPINGGNAVEALDELYKSMAKQIFGAMKLGEQDLGCVQHLDNCREYLQDIKAEDLDGSEPALGDLLVDIAAFIGPEPLSGVEHEQRWLKAVANINPPLAPNERKDFADKCMAFELKTLTGRQLNALAEQCQQHNPLTGRHTDSLGALACSVERKIRVEATQDLTQMQATEQLAEESVKAKRNLEPRWHLFKLQATGGDDASGDLYADMLVSALSGSQSIAEDLARAAADDALPEGYSVTHSEFVCVCDRDVWQMVSSDEPIEGFHDAEQEARIERQHG